jgi:hypothetical protein
MMAGTIATSRLLMDLEDVARREDMTPRDPWEPAPDYYPEDAGRLVVLRLDGKVERLDLDLDPDWSTIAAYRFEDVFGDKVDEGDPDPDPDWDFDDEPKAANDP